MAAAGGAAAIGPLFGMTIAKGSRSAMQPATPPDARVIPLSRDTLIVPSINDEEETAKERYIAGEWGDILDDPEESPHGEGLEPPLIASSDLYLVSIASTPNGESKWSGRRLNWPGQFKLEPLKRNEHIFVLRCLQWPASDVVLLVSVCWNVWVDTICTIEPARALSSTPWTLVSQV